MKTEAIRKSHSFQNVTFIIQKCIITNMCGFPHCLSPSQQFLALTILADIELHKFGEVGYARWYTV